MNDTYLISIGAVVLAAGQSTRMGRPKMIMPWKNTTIIAKVVETLVNADVNPIVIVTGGAHEEVEKAVSNFPVKCVFNPQYRNGEMLYSLQAGLSSMQPDVNAVLIVLGDQPFIQGKVVRDVMEVYRREFAELVVPSYQMRRGHPWLVDRHLWEQLMALSPPQTLRHFMRANDERIQYLNVNTPSILQDLDTPEDYAQQHPTSDQ
jgi:molybdenum cofactor cytidylyltransferase